MNSGSITKQIFMLAGELSGDLHGSRLIQSLKHRNPDCNFKGVGGPGMRKEGLECFIPMEEFQVMGYSDVIKALPRLIKHFKTIVNQIMITQPDVVVLIDYPGLNLRLAKALRKKKFTKKIVQYISPTVWAHGKKRIEQMSATLDALLTILPFEPACFKDTPLSVSYVGHPLIENIRNYKYSPLWRHEIGISFDLEMIGLFPGSRPNEIERNLPILLETACRIKKDNPKTCFGLSVAHENLEELMRSNTSKYSLNLNQDIYLVPKKYTYELMEGCRSAIAKSGTVTLELALHQVPTVVVYAVTALNRFVARHILKLNLAHYCIVNLLLEARVFPELIEKGFDSATLYSHFKELHFDGPVRAICMAACQRLPEMLSAPKSHMAADIILS